MRLVNIPDPIPDDLSRVAAAYSDDGDFREALHQAPEGVLTAEAWIRWHRHVEESPQPRQRTFPDGTVAPLWKELAWAKRGDL